MQITVTEQTINISQSTGQGDKSREKGVICSFCLATEHRDILDRIAQEANTTKAQVVRSAIEFLGAAHDSTTIQR